LWTLEIETDFVNLWESFTSVPILIHLNPNGISIIDTDLSICPLRAVQYKIEDNDILHSRAYDSSKFSLAAIKDDTNNKKHLAIMDSIKIWNRYHQGTLLSVLIHTTSRNLEYITTIIVLNQRQAY
jgi:hypothetical protein